MSTYPRVRSTCTSVSSSSSPNLILTCVPLSVTGVSIFENICIKRFTGFPLSSNVFFSICTFSTSFRASRTLLYELEDTPSSLSSMRTGGKLSLSSRVITGLGFSFESFSAGFLKYFPIYTCRCSTTFTMMFCWSKVNPFCALA